MRRILLIISLAFLLIVFVTVASSKDADLGEISILRV